MQERRRRRVSFPVRLFVAIVTLVSVSVGHGPLVRGAAGRSSAVQTPSASKPQLYVDAVVVDRKGNLVRDMKPSEFSVMSDHGTQRVVSVIPLFRGPGAEESARLARGTDAGGEVPRTEPARVVLFVVDQASLLRGDEARVGAVVESCLGLLGFGDHLGLMVLPGPAGSMPMRRDAIRAALAEVKPLRAQGTEPAEDIQKPGESAQPQRAISSDPERADVARGAAERAPTPDKLLEDRLAPGKIGDDEVISRGAVRDHATSTLDGLQRLLAELRLVPGGKTILFLSAGVSSDEMAEEFERVAMQAAVNDTRIYVLQVPTPARKFADIGRPGLETLARLTGGALVTLGSKPAEALQRTIGELALSYLLVLERFPGELSGGVPVAVKTRRSNVIVRSASWATAGRLLPSATPASSPTPDAPTIPSLTAAPPVASTGPVHWKRDAAVETLVARAAGYVQSYWAEVSAVVAEEAYEQQVIGATPGTAQKRKLVSDFLLVKVPGDVGWIPFRDVFEVDGQQVRERENRLQKLFLDAPPDKAIENAHAIFEESARYNLGTTHRTLNVPTLPLIFIAAGNMRRFEFKKSGEDNEGGMRAWVVEYREVGRPTIIRTTAGKDVPAAGRFWIEPTSGRVVKTTLEAGGASITVTYRPSRDASGIWFPATMDERYGRSIVAKARYSNIRRFQVLTDEKIKEPK